MLNNCSNGFSQQNNGTANDAVDNFMEALTSTELWKLEAFMRGFKGQPDVILPIIERLANLVNTPELKVVGRKFSWKDCGVTRWGVVCEFNLVRTQRILLVPTEAGFPSAVIEHAPGRVGVVSTDCPKVMLRQVGRIANLRSAPCPPPMAFSYGSMPPLARV